MYTGHVATASLHGPGRPTDVKYPFKVMAKEKQKGTCAPAILPLHGLDSRLMSNNPFWKITDLRFENQFNENKRLNIKLKQ